MEHVYLEVEKPALAGLASVVPAKPSSTWRMEWRIEENGSINEVRRALSSRWWCCCFYSPLFLDCKSVFKSSPVLSSSESINVLPRRTFAVRTI
jgi:hypothetical protein